MFLAYWATHDHVDVRSCRGFSSAWIRTRHTVFSSPAFFGMLAGRPTARYSPSPPRPHARPLWFSWNSFEPIPDDARLYLAILLLIATLNSVFTMVRDPARSLRYWSITILPLQSSVRRQPEDILPHEKAAAMFSVDLLTGQRRGEGDREVEKACGHLREDGKLSGGGVDFSGVETIYSGGSRVVPITPLYTDACMAAQSHMHLWKRAHTRVATMWCLQV